MRGIGQVIQHLGSISVRCACRSVPAAFNCWGACQPPRYNVGGPVLSAATQPSCPRDLLQHSHSQSIPAHSSHVKPLFWGGAVGHHSSAAMSFRALATSADPAAVGPELGAVEDFAVLHAIHNHLERVAVISGGKSFKYQDVLAAATRLASLISQGTDVTGERVALVAPPGVEFVAGTWASWICNAISVPLALSHPPSELKYAIRDSGASMVVAHPDYKEKLAPIAEECGARLLVLSPGCSTVSDTEGQAAAELTKAAAESIAMEDGCLIIYTSGTTGRPKGVLHTHGSISAQISSLSSAWQWQSDDHVLHCLPLHHIHGLVNALHSAHTNGAAVEFQPFSPAQVWKAIRGDATVFMGVPTMYSLLLASYEKMNEDDKAAAAAAASSLRLAISGSAACPLVIMESWRNITGTKLLERYGMTEIGMALSNPFEGERRPGFVGLPLPGVEVRVIPGTEDEDRVGDEGPFGELKVRAPQLFSKYWGRPEATSEAFDEDGFFLTGDSVVLAGKPPYWKIVGRSSVDIIKSSGYKISALDIENKLLTHPAVRECAVLGIPDDVRGEVVGAVIACHEGDSMDLEELAAWCRDKMPPYHIPKSVCLMATIPRNAMGKINKKELLKQISG